LHEVDLHRWPRNRTLGVIDRIIRLGGIAAFLALFNPLLFNRILSALNGPAPRHGRSSGRHDWFNGGR
jgi:hypothetical protein